MKSSLKWFYVSALSVGLFAATIAEPQLTMKKMVRDRVYRPGRVAIADAGTVAITDFQRKQICFFDRDLRFLSSIAIPTAPFSVAFAADGSLYVGVANDVLRMTMQGSVIDRFSSHGASPAAPVDIAVGANGLVYVADRENHRVSVYSSGGILQFSFGTFGNNDGQLHSPSGLVLDADAIIVADAGNSRVQFFSLQGVFQRKFGGHVRQVDTTWTTIGLFAHMQGIAVDGAHRIYVADSGLDHVQIFSAQGSHLGFAGKERHPSTQLRVPIGMAITDSSFYLTSLAGSEVRAYTISGITTSVTESSLPQTYGLEQNYPNPFNPTTVIRFSLPSEGLVILKVYDITGREVKTVLNEARTAGNYSTQWDGKNNAGNHISSGIYFYRLNIPGRFTQTKKMILLK